MAAISTLIAGIGLAIGVAGTAVQMKAAGDAAAASRRAERLRQQQMDLEAARARRTAIRNSLKARAMALTNASSQGAQFGSGLQGGFGQIGGETGRQIVGINQGQEIGAGIFQANMDGANAQSLVAFGSGLSSLGSGLVNNAGTIGQIGTYFSSPRTG